LRIRIGFKISSRLPLHKAQPSRTLIPTWCFPSRTTFQWARFMARRPANSTNHQAENAKGNNEEVIEISDDKDDNDVSVLTTKTQDELVALLVQTRKQLSGATVGSRVASGSDPPPRKRPSCHALPNQCRWAGVHLRQQCLCRHRRWRRRRQRSLQRARWQIVADSSPPESTRRGTPNVPSG
jgi:hypothetical protein